MGTTTISLKDEAYQGLKAGKKEGESFSDATLRRTDSPTTEEQIAALSGDLGAEFAEEVEMSAEQVEDELEMDPGRPK